MYLQTRTAEANHWNSCETKGIEFVGKLRLTQGLDFKNDDDAQSDHSIREKINAILARIPEEFELEENLTEILKLVLDQELQVLFRFKPVLKAPFIAQLR